MSAILQGYYKHPEGQDVFGKMLATNSMALGAGLIFSKYDILFITKPKGYVQTLGRCGYFCGPFMGMATAFTMTTYAANRLRGKDDTWNYILGACASAGVFGAWRRSFVLGCEAALYFSIVAAIKKLSINEGWEFFPHFDKHEYGHIRYLQNDFTLTEERPKAYITKN
ncbi:NADH dehydrogenase [ubiquinone] 1 alpha subcomplex subunit 11 [Pseudolycoriella hygida]|uniref:NADH dehydrogenase [ubiquinone] 1 alpha subcomplex subunit 11 n=1 Tax=Pseudolycoriella hygida TaxID=35572 RepID=A0A9Q0RVD5_9DIPT|nr:NADH dehydrogenase [ubiquinone] 1 alpha subcomplex subunit 11 [Pseudolycoriella hygida]